MELTLIQQTIADYRRDRRLWAQPGRVAQGAEPHARVFSVRGARITATEPLVNLTVIDRGSARLVAVATLDEAADVAATARSK